MVILSKRVHEKGGITIRCDIGKKSCTSLWTNPPNNIDHVDLKYIRDRYPIVTTWLRAEEFKEKYKALFASEKEGGPQWTTGRLMNWPISI